MAKAKYGSGRFAKWCDSIIKLQRIIESPLVSEKLVWLYDDTFILRPTTTADLSVPRVTRLLCANTNKPAKRKWREVLRRTTIALHDAGRPALNYSHHGPVVFEKSKLAETIDQFHPEGSPRAIESLYMNHHFDKEESQPLGNWMTYTQKPSVNWRPNPESTIINVGSFRVSVERAMHERFPDPCLVESDGDPK